LVAALTGAAFLFYVFSRFSPSHFSSSPIAHVKDKLCGNAVLAYAGSLLIKCLRKAVEKQSRTARGYAARVLNPSEPTA